VVGSSAPSKKRGCAEAHPKAKEDERARKGGKEIQREVCWRRGVWGRKRNLRKERFVREDGGGARREKEREKEKRKEEEKEEGEGERKGRIRKEQRKKRGGKKKKRVVGVRALLRNRRGTAQR
jgi:hypothetical protein